MNNRPSLRENQIPVEPSNRRRWVLGTLLALALVLGLSLATGLPQTHLVQWAAEQYLETRVELDGVSLLRAFHADSVRIYDVGAGDPTLILEDVALTRDFFSADGRVIPELRIARIELDVIARSSEDSNIDFVRARLERPSEGPSSMRYVPRRVFIEQILLDAQLSDMGLHLDNLQFEASFTAADRFAVAVTGDDIDGTRWFSTPHEKHTIENGAVDLFVQQNDEGMLLTLDADLPDLLMIAAKGGMTRRPGGDVWDIAIASAQAEGLALAGLEGLLLPTPIQFASLSVTDSQVQLVQGPDLAVPNAKLNLDAKDLYVGAPGELWYRGDLGIKGAVMWDADRRADVVVTFGHGQAATLAVSGSVQSGAADIVIANWSQPELLDVVPTRYRSQAQALPQFTGLSGTLAARWDDLTYNIDLDCTSSTGPTGGGLTLKIDGAGTRAGDGPPFAGNLEVGIGKGTLKGAVRRSSRTSAEADLAIEQAELNRWLQVVLGERAPALPDATVRGSIALAARDFQQGLHVHPKLEITNLTLAGRAITDAAPLAAAGDVQWDRKESRLTSPALAITVPDRADLTLTSWQHDLTGKTGKASATAHLEVDWLELGELWGNLDWAGSISYNAQGAQAPLTFTSANLGWGDWSVPYGKKLEGGGKANLTYEGRRVTITEARAALDDKNLVQLPKGTVVLSPFTAELPVVLTTDLSPVVAMGLLESASGSGSFEGTIRQAADGLAFQGTGRVAAEALALPSNRATLATVQLETKLSYKDGFQGAGTATAGAVTISNATLQDVTSTLRWENKQLRLQEIHGNLYNGRSDGSLTLGLLEQGRPLEADMQFSGVDLAQFSAALAPADFQMTGSAHGKASVAIKASALTNLQVEAESRERFTISREMVEKMLKMPRFAESLGERTLNKILGAAPQRPFNRAALTLTLKDTNSLQGQAILESEKTEDYRGLDLTVDLDVPVTGLADLMALASDAAK